MRARVFVYVSVCVCVCVCVCVRARAIFLNDDCSRVLLYKLAKCMAACVRKMAVSML